MVDRSDKDAAVVDRYRRDAVVLAAKRRSENQLDAGLASFPPPPIDEMAGWIEQAGVGTPKGPETVPTDWATACQVLFHKRQPSLYPEIWDDIWAGIPFAGDTLWVVSVKPPENYGLLVLPDSVRPVQLEGWVLSVGWGICRPGPGGRRSPFESPLDLVGQRIFWGMYTGEDLGVGAFNMPHTDEAGAPIPARNRPALHQYWSVKIGDVRGLSLKTGGLIR